MYLRQFEPRCGFLAAQLQDRSLGVPSTEDINFCRRLGTVGDAIGQYSVGMLYRKGESVKQDDAEAIKWFRRAADQGFPEAQVSLARMYGNGHGVKEDDAEAMKWVLKAANHGYKPAFELLGDSYEVGDGVPQNNEEAFFWYRLWGLSPDNKFSQLLTADQRVAVEKRVEEWKEKHPSPNHFSPGDWREY